MRTTEEYYEIMLQNREIMADPENTKCPCPGTLCEWHGKCKQCVALHRYHGDHVPACLQPILEDKIQALAAAAEMITVKKEPTSVEYRQYVRDMDQKRAQEDSEA